MIIELIIVVAYILFCIKASPKTILISIVLLLPIHGFIKAVVFTDSGSLFALWKEIGILFVFYKTRSLGNKRISNLLFFIALFDILFAIYLYVGYIRGYTVLADIRKFIFPVILLWGVSKLSFKQTDIRNLITSIIIGSIIINITGVVDFFMPEIRLLMRTLMGIKYQIALDGNVYYEISSYKIMGIDRVAGFMGGGPNMLGVYNAVVLLFCVYAYITKLFQGVGFKSLFYLGLSLSCFCILTSFSRAGWALLAITVLYIGYTRRSYRKYVYWVISFGALLSASAYFAVENVRTVIDGTFSGNEASSAKRGSMTQDAFEFLLNNPWGAGVGASNHDAEQYLYFAESSWLNLGIAVGFVGAIFYLVLLYNIYIRVKTNRHSNFRLIATGFIIAYSITGCVSVNVVENPFVYYAWLIMGLGLCNMKVERRNSISFRQKQIERSYSSVRFIDQKRI